MDEQRRSLILVTGQEGAGKTTVMRALLPHTPRAAKLDAEDVGQVNPFTFDQPFLELLWNNVTDVISNFWDAGYRTVITGSLLRADTYTSYQQFREHLPDDVATYVVHLHASKVVRDRRRRERTKPSTQDWRDRVDAAHPAADRSLRDNARTYRHISINNAGQRLSETIATIKASIPEIYGDSAVGEM